MGQHPDLARRTWPPANASEQDYTRHMEITVDLPGDIAQGPDPAREALEALVIEGYRSGALTA